MFRILSALFVSLFLALPAAAQQPVWVQIEAQRTLTGAQDAARGYAARGVDDVTGFALPGGWYGIALGPYSAADAASQLRRLRASGLIPSDSYTVDGGRFRTQFWPVGVTAPADPVAVETPATTETPVANVQPVVVPEPDPIQTPDETLREAQASEQALDRDEKRLLQTALQWAGFYNSAIDGSYGRGTRQSMRDWQEAKNHEVTGVLTTNQRAELLNDYNSILDGMGLQLVRDDATGIEMQIPTGVVKFAEYEPPFARFDASGDLDAQVLLISQPGDQTRMFGLYEILQTLAIIPPEGERRRRDRGFEIEGIDENIHSYTSVVLENGEIKGFTLVWPAGDDERRRRILTEMQASFATVDGVLDPAISRPDEDQAIDLIAGLAVRKPVRDRSGFYINTAGEVLTSVEAIAECTSITLGMEHIATVVHQDDALGLAVLRPTDRLSPPAVAEFQTGVPRLNADIAVAGFPYGGVLTTPALTFGRLADIRGLNGEDEVKRLSIFAQPGDVGGPVFDNGGAVLGMLLPKVQTNGQSLPPEVSFSVDADQIITSLTDAGLAVQTTDSLAYMTPEVLTLMAADMAVLVSCWED
ncbi:trypsin-like peptidase domain-containing protein [Octadecabacter sp. 1_MG-2023]|uniref:trypsin-like peptidase domain-containing protein n=1 Tax=unclassified Octadecabacter TaxID=196158 RepID=UPI001C09F888|nr:MULTISPECIES: trypsin-like peptidase domain-containing protein [unclassified Octadecabacter]MBU2992786.1 trypsin-like peptidase domain-containing protein [Octadecabacter sp. B2R22]MDO6733763.1 trypsin-like peptidase domain-containing protein [Octadecabacter sp. 1_MG-2023]